MRAWHFLRKDKKLGYNDGRLVRVGHTFKCDPDSIKMCETGFHASKNILDALNYAFGPIACEVELGGNIIKGYDKIVASERTVISMVDAEDVLHEFACWCAERALSRIKNPDPRSITAIEAKRKWLKGEISDDGLAAARDAAWDAAWDEAWDAAWNAARAVAWDAARAAARAAARDAERKVQSRKLTKMIRNL